MACLALEQFGKHGLRNGLVFAFCGNAVPQVFDELQALGDGKPEEGLEFGVRIHLGASICMVCTVLVTKRGTRGNGISIAAEPLVALFYATARDSPTPNKLLTQRPQIVGCAASAPTSSRQCQQRSHLVAVDGVTRTDSIPKKTSPTA